MPTRDVRQVSGPVRGVPGEAELGRVVQHQDGAGGHGEPAGGGREVPTQNGPAGYPGVVEEPVGGLGRGPVLAGHRHGPTDAVGEVRREPTEPRRQPVVREHGAGQLPLDPGVHGRPSRSGHRPELAPRA